MQTLIWLLVLGGVFYFIMRIGRSAQMAGGHGVGHAGGCCGGGHTNETHQAHEEHQGSITGNKDPVCGMYVTTKDAACSLTYDGVNYYFCSQGCLDKFKISPARYTAVTEHAGHV